MTEAEIGVLAADEARYQALYARDIPSLAGMLLDGYVHTHATGKVDDRHSFLVSIESARYRFVQAVRREQRVRLVGDVAILDGKTATTIEMAGVHKTLHTAFVTVWVNRQGRWMLLHWQATKLPDE